jgi:glycosyltransferase involved in cell wall biosynthesis
VTPTSRPGEAPRLSLVVPAFNEAALLPRLLGTVAVARSRYVHGPDRIEVVVADNASTDDTAAIARAHGCRVAPVERHVIAAVRNGGAALARGSLLAFVDADMQVHPGTFNAIDAALCDARIIGGASGITAERWSPGIVFGYYCVFLPLARAAGVEAGVAFCRRRDWEAVGGYDERLRFAEDVDFLWRLRRLGRTRRQRLIRLRGVKAVYSTRKFDQHGDWHIISQGGRLLLGLLAHRPTADRIVERYWYTDRR